MKKINLFVALLAAIVVSACVKPQEDITLDGDYTIVTVDLVKHSKTALGEKGDKDEYPIRWVASDRLVMNGIASSEIVINEEDCTRASFRFEKLITGERLFTFPYTEGSSCTKEQPTVVFPAEQNYVAGTFDLNAAPMYGYSPDGNSATTLQHLAGVLRLPFKATVGNPVLKQISITPVNEDVTLAGEYAVDCHTGELTLVEGTATKSIVYTIKNGVTLNTSKAIPFYITLPKGDFGSCIIAITDADGRSMMLKWTANNIKAGVVREIKDIPYRAEAEVALDPFDSEKDDIYIAADGDINEMESLTDDVVFDYIPGIVFGHIKDNAGNPLQGIAVSDGFTVVKTDKNGFYQMASNPEAFHIFYTVPANYEIPMDENGQVAFFQKYSHFHSLYDFTLTPLAGGAENKFVIFGLADPQVSNDTGYNRFIAESVPKIKAHADKYRAQGIPSYGVVLGDIITMSTASDKTSYMYKMRSGFAEHMCGMPAFYVMGNHDHNYHNEQHPLTTNWQNKTTNIRAQRLYEKIFGPANYSFDRGNVHIVCMRNIIFTTATTPGSYVRGFTDEQCAWLEQDLANVSKDKMIVFCVHIPMYNKDPENTNNNQTVLRLLNTYSKVHILSGHMHYNNNYEHSVMGTSHTNIYEHNIGAVCGVWWCSNICGDGAPNGYKVFEVTNGNMSNFYYQGTPDGMDGDFRMRLYRGNAITGGERPADAAEDSTMGYYQFGFADNVLLANIFSSDAGWKVAIYENGVKTGDMEWMYKYGDSGKLSDLVGSYVWDDPTRMQESITTAHDFWAHGFLMGVLGRSTEANASFNPCYSMWKGTLKNKNAAKIEVRATDRFNNQFTCDVITEGTDYRYAAKP